MNAVDVSVVIPTLNEQSAIAASVASARQAGADEVIVADGGSDDETMERISQLAQRKFLEGDFYVWRAWEHCGELIGSVDLQSRGNRTTSWLAAR